MTLTINHPDAILLVQELIGYTGETLTQAVLNALRERIKKEKERQKGAISLKDELLQIGKQCAALPVLDNRSPEEILGYNKDGVTN
ncbi:MAG: type II toxin-antitoxin system VapB family antitoxin [Pseudomonadota bacterium]